MICITGKNFERSVDGKYFRAFRDVKTLSLDRYSSVVLTALCDYVDLKLGSSEDEEDQEDGSSKDEDGSSEDGSFEDEEDEEDGSFEDDKEDDPCKDDKEDDPSKDDKEDDSSKDEDDEDLYDDSEDGPREHEITWHEESGPCEYNELYEDCGDDPRECIGECGLKTINGLSHSFQRHVTKENRLFLARLNLRALVGLSNLCLYLDFDKLMHLCMARLAYCLLRGHHMEIVEKYHPPRLSSRISPGDVVWSSYYKVRDALYGVLESWLWCDPVMLIASDPVPYSFLSRTGLSNQELFELAVTKSALQDLDYFRGCTWTKDLVQCLHHEMEDGCTRALAVWRRYMTQMPLDDIRYQSTLRYREAIRACPKLPVVDPIWLRKDWITLRELLQRATPDDVKWICTPRFIKDADCVSMAGSFLSRVALDEAVALGLVLSDQSSPELEYFVKHGTLKSVFGECDLFVDTPDFDLLSKSQQSTVKIDLRYKLHHYTLYHDWAVSRGVYSVPDPTGDPSRACMDMMLNFGHIPHIIYFIEMWYKVPSFFDVELRRSSEKTMIRAILSHPKLKHADVPRWFKHFCRGAYVRRFWRQIIAADEKDFLSAALSRFEAYETRPVCGYEVVLCSDGKTSMSARVLRRCQHLKMSSFMPCALSKKQVQWLRTGHRFVPKTLYQALSAWRVSYRAGNYGLCLYHAEHLVTLLAKHPEQREWLSDDFKRWPHQFLSAPLSARLKALLVQ